MQRENWRYQYTIKQLKKAVAGRITYHSGRLDFWAKELEIAKENLKSASTEIKEFPVTGGTRLQVVVDPTWERRTNECQFKVEMHRNKVTEFKKYRDVFAPSSEADVMTLDMDDV